jgi:RNA polymerase sigma factor (sigma-70 family)
MDTSEEDTSDSDEIAASLVVPERFGRVAERHFGAIFQYLARRVGRDLAQDLSAETFVVAFGARTRYDLTRANARPWLFGIATNLIRRHRRNELRTMNAYARSVPPACFDDQAEELAIHMDHVALLVRVAEAFSKLDPEQRDAIHLTAIEGLSYGETAEALDIPIGTVHSRVARARTTLRDLAGYFGQEVTEESISAREVEKRS